MCLCLKNECFPNCILFCCCSTVRDMLHHLTYVSSSMTPFAYFDRIKFSISGDFYGSVSRIYELAGLMQFCSSEALVIQRHPIKCKENFINIRILFNFFVYQERLAHILVGRTTNNTAQQCNAVKKTRKHRHANHTDANAKRANHENGI